MKTRTKVIAGILVVLLSASLAVSCYMIWSELSQQKKEKDIFSQLAELAELPEPQTEPEIQDTDPAEETIPPAVHKHDFTGLKEQNSECVAWICIPDTAVDYPIMHTPKQPQKYLRMDFYGDYSQSGVPFLDFRCTEDSTNLITYGHNMKNGTMYADIRYYADPSFCESHPVIEWETEEGVKNYTVFAAAVVNKLDGWYDFINAGSEDDYTQHIQTLADKALYVTDAISKYGTRLLTLSTCYGGDSDSRLIVVAAAQ